jgi:hypothetical protein
MTFLAMLLLALALGAALLGAVQQARELRRLRDDLDALARPRLIDTPDAIGTGASLRMFSGLYEEAPSALDGLKRLPGVGGVALAALLGLLGSGFVLRVASDRPEKAVPTEVAAGTVDSVAMLRSSRDSLAVVVIQLRDSMDLAERKAAETAVTARRAPARRASPTSRAPRPAQVSPPPALPPAPQLGSGAVTP